VFPALSRSLTIEPNPELAEPIARSAEALGVDNSHFVGVAWSSDTLVRGRHLMSGMFAIEEAPDGDIPAKSIDRLAGEEPFDFIKMDVEGTERQVIAGARKALSRARCVAMAAYHLPADLRTLPSAVEKDGEAWNLAFNHYSQTFDDSIFYLWRQSAQAAKR
jgi:FkbM family methyltransferase